MKRKVWLLPAHEGWICDRFVEEWNADNVDTIVKDPEDADVIWLLSEWQWHEIPYEVLRYRRVLTTIHHIVPENFNTIEMFDFHLRDKFTTAYHVYNQRTYDFIRPLTVKPIHLVHYWANQRIWHRTDEVDLLRRRHNLPIDAYLVGSFQRDTNESDLSPRLEKGPDLFIEYVRQLDDQRRDEGLSRVHVVLTGWQRQYVIRRLRELGVLYSYFERAAQATVNELYQTLNLYPVTSRHEGGPQPLIECGLLGVRVISRPVGIAEQVLPTSAIDDDVALAEPAIPNVNDWTLPVGYEPYKRLLEVI